MGLDPAHARPELFIWTALPIPPLCIRPSVGQENARYVQFRISLAVLLNFLYFSARRTI